MKKKLSDEFGWSGASFDFDSDGTMDPAEAQFARNALNVIQEARNAGEEKALFELASSGVDISAFDFRDKEEYRAAIKGAGLDPEDFDFK
ncbi:MAG: hypothetical protein ACI4LA_01765 [Emergencia sp.]